MAGLVESPEMFVHQSLPRSADGHEMIHLESPACWTAKLCQ